MFERFTDGARRVVVLAQEEARRLQHNYIGTEHLLLGLIHEGDGVAAQVLVSRGISLETVRREVEGIIGRGGSSPARLPFTPRAKKVLELSLREALQLDHHYIGTEHILLGLIREGEGVAAQVLVLLGADLSSVRARVIETVRENPKAAALARDRPSPRVELPTSISSPSTADEPLLRYLQQAIATRTLAFEALVAARSGDDDRLLDLLRTLVMQAAAADDQVQLVMLARIVDIADAATGEITLGPAPDPPRPDV